MDKVAKETLDKRVAHLSERRPWRYVARYPFTFPGGYAVIAVTADGGVICSECVRAEYRTVAHDSRTHVPGSGWRVVGLMTGGDVDGSTLCDHCGRELCAYVDDDE